jgi:2'-5' RNA ligase
MPAGPGERPWRLFVAVPFGDELRAQLAQAVEGWRRDPRAERMSWTDPAGWHVTLAFLGATEPARVPQIAPALARATDGLPPFTLATGGIGGFPSARRARVAWYGVADPQGRLRSLAAAVHRELRLDAGARFRGHLTLARARGGRFAEVDLGGWLRPEDAPTGDLAVERIILYRSHMGRGPARYEALAEVPLGVAIHA